ncbi:unnamed protein product [Paramecium sonneborni]|uniref:Uncharacterized protein n=1 Tax=Paramecium sonneborni TaxID=65129 RepID=A0A8S1QNG2_9CILI|nr:unnamed protein product [Paramecium sonneborni]
MLGKFQKKSSQTINLQEVYEFFFLKLQFLNQKYLNLWFLKITFIAIKSQLKFFKLTLKNINININFFELTQNLRKITFDISKIIKHFLIVLNLHRVIVILIQRIFLHIIRFCFEISNGLNGIQEFCYNYSKCIKDNAFGNKVQVTPALFLIVKQLEHFKPNFTVGFMLILDEIADDDKLNQLINHFKISFYQIRTYFTNNYDIYYSLREYCLIIQNKQLQNQLEQSQTLFPKRK